MQHRVWGTHKTTSKNPMTSDRRKHRKKTVHDPYAEFVDHPRYGRKPLFTGLNPHPSDEGVRLNRYGSVELTGGAGDYSWRPLRIENTAVEADPGRQTPAIIPVTHYFDLECRCQDCEQGFIFFAREQVYWYEVLGFSLDADCVRCVACRKKLQGVARRREVYESLFHVSDKSEAQTLEMAEVCLDLIESGDFGERKIEHVRMLLNSVPTNSRVRKHSRYQELAARASRA